MPNATTQTQFIVLGHGHFASGLISAATFIGGPRANLYAIDFVDGMSDETLAQVLSEYVQTCSADAELVFICDLLGGSPYKVAAPWVLRYPKRCQLVVGVNLGALIDTLLKASKLDAAAAAENLIQASAKYLYTFEAPAPDSATASKAETPADGI
ncbi:MAG: PTS sugar transporter subunit IIA [Actinomycetes bacterium]|jgi:PTS system N-acetylgalactosamine-specific IIA component|nr:PTS sugar transporter subunit IIA [Actinomycetes bacterium]